MKTKAKILINLHWILTVIFKIYLYFLICVYITPMSMELYIGLIIMSLFVDLPVYLLLYILAKKYDEQRKDK